MPEVLPGTDRRASLKKQQSSQVNVLIKLICPIVKGTATGNEDPHILENSRRQDTETRDRWASKGTKVKELSDAGEGNHTRRLETTSSSLERDDRRLENEQEDGEWNENMTRAWEEQRRNWRELEPRDDEDAEIYGDKVYSPPADTREGKERKERRRQTEKAGKLTERWGMMRECKKFLEENSEMWERRTVQEGKRIEKEEKKTRLEMVERKKKNYGKAGNKKLNAEEEGKIRNETMRKRELAEIKQNLWRAYRENGKETLAPTRPKKVPEGRKKEEKLHHQSYPSVADSFSTKRDDKIRAENQLGDQWDLLEVCVKYIEENEDWLTTNRLERSYQQEEKKKMWEKEERLDRMANKIGPKKEMTGRNKNKTCPGMEERDDEMHLKTEPYQMDGNLQQETRPTSQVEGKLTVARLKKFEMFDNDKTVVRKSFKKVTVENSEEKVSKKEDSHATVLGRVELSDKIVEMKNEMQARTPRKPAALRSTKTPNQCRSVGRVVKNKGTPRKQSNVRNLKKYFETSPTRGPTELLSQLVQSRTQGIKFKLGTTTPSRSLTQKFCVDQPGGLTGTGPRQDCDGRLQPGQDWPDRTSLDTVGPIADAVVKDQNIEIGNHH